MLVAASFTPYRPAASHEGAEAAFIGRKFALPASSMVSRWLQVSVLKHRDFPRFYLSRCGATELEREVKCPVCIKFRAIRLPAEWYVGI